MSTNTVRNGSSVVLNYKVSLPYRRLWNYTVLAYDCKEHTLLETNELSNTFFKFYVRYYVQMIAIDDDHFQAPMTFRTSQSLPLNMVKSE